MKALHVLLVVAVLGLSAYAQSSLPRPENWGPTKQGVRVSLSLDKSTYAVGEDIPLHIKAQVVAAEHPLYGIPDRPTGSFFMKWDFAQAFHLSILDENGQIVGNDEPSNLRFVVGGSSGPKLCPVPLEVSHVYLLEQSATTRQKLLPTQPGTYRLTVTWSPYRTSDPPCDIFRATSDLENPRPFVTASSLPITIHITGHQ